MNVTVSIILVIGLILLYVLGKTIKMVREEKRRQFLQSRKEAYHKNLEESKEQTPASQTEETEHPYVRFVSSNKE